MNRPGVRNVKFPIVWGRDRVSEGPVIYAISVLNSAFWNLIRKMELNLLFAVVVSGTSAPTKYFDLAPGTLFFSINNTSLVLMSRPDV